MLINVLPRHFELIYLIIIPKPANSVIYHSHSYPNDMVSIRSPEHIYKYFIVRLNGI